MNGLTSWPAHYIKNIVLIISNISKSDFLSKIDSMSFAAGS